MKSQFGDGRGPGTLRESMIFVRPDASVTPVADRRMMGDTCDDITSRRMTFVFSGGTRIICSVRILSGPIVRYIGEWVAADVVGPILGVVTQSSTCTRVQLGGFLFERQLACDFCRPFLSFPECWRKTGQRKRNDILIRVGITRLGLTHGQPHNGRSPPFILFYLFFPHLTGRRMRWIMWKYHGRVNIVVVKYVEHISAYTIFYIFLPDDLSLWGCNTGGA